MTEARSEPSAASMLGETPHHPRLDALVASTGIYRNVFTCSFLFLSPPREADRENLLPLLPTGPSGTESDASSRTGGRDGRQQRISHYGGMPRADANDRFEKEKRKWTKLSGMNPAHPVCSTEQTEVRGLSLHSHLCLCSRCQKFTCNSLRTRPMGRGPGFRHPPLPHPRAPPE